MINRPTQIILAIFISDIIALCGNFASGAESPAPLMTGLHVQIIIDRSDIDTSIQQNLFRGLRVGFQKNNKDLTKIKVYYLDQPVVDLQKALRAIAKDRRPKIVLAWIGKASFEQLRPILEESNLPIIMLNHSEERLPQNSNLSSSYPSSLDLGVRLGQYVADKGLRKIGVMQSMQHIDESFNRGFHQSYIAAGGMISRVERYQSADFDGLLMSLRKILSGMDMPPPLPKGTAVEKIEVTNEPAAKSDVQGILVLDDFRMTRHIAKTLKYLSSEKLTLFGNYLWRSPALIDPREPYLDGSFFADHIGEYTDLSFHDPKDLFESNRLLIIPEVTEAYDFAFLGEQGALLAASIDDACVRYHLNTTTQVMNYMAKMRTVPAGKLIAIESGRLVLLR